jgi:hypothetical protein
MYWGSSVICMSVYYIEQYIWIAPDYITSSCNPTVQLELAGGGGGFCRQNGSGTVSPCYQNQVEIELPPCISFS